MRETDAALLAFAAGRSGGGEPRPAGLAALATGFATAPAAPVETADDRIAAREAELAEAVARIRALAAGLSAARRIDPGEVRAEVASLALTVVTALIGGSPDLLAAGVAARVDAALDGLAARRAGGRLHLSPADLAFLGPAWPDLDIVADEALTAGSFRLVHGDAEVEDSLADRLIAAADWLGAQ